MLSASPHRVAVLVKCPPPDTVRGLRSFIGAYKVLSRVLPNCSAHTSPLESAIAGYQFQDKIGWTDDLYQKFYSAQKALSTHKSMTLPRADDQIWIVTDGSVTRQGIGATMYVSRENKPLLADFSAIAGYQFQDKIGWTDDLYQKFYSAQKALSTHKSITLPRADDQIWIVTDGSVTRQGIGATMYVSRENKPLLADFFSAKLRKHQVTWFPCEIEVLSIVVAIKHFGPYIIQSTHNTCLLTDSKPCLRADEILCRGEFSASLRVTSFLSTVSRYQINVRHLMAQ